MNTSDRLGTLEGTLSRKPHLTPAPAAQPEESKSNNAVHSAPETTRTSKGTPNREAPRKSTESGGETRRVAFRLAPELHEALTRRVTTEATSQSHVVLDAIEAAHAANSLTSPAGGGDSGESAGSLFTRPTLKRRATPAVPTEIRVDATTLQTIDRLVEETQADNRTELITRALRHHLTT